LMTSSHRLAALAADVLQSQLVGTLTEEEGMGGYVQDIVTLVAGARLRNCMSSIMRCRSGVMWVLLRLEAAYWRMRPDSVFLRSCPPRHSRAKLTTAKRFSSTRAANSDLSETSAQAVEDKGR
jgi:hypothetical protein